MSNQNIPIQQILRSKKLSRSELLMAQYCDYYLGRLATKVRGTTHPRDPRPYLDKRLVENLYYLSGAILELTLDNSE